MVSALVSGSSNVVQARALAEDTAKRIHKISGKLISSTGLALLGQYPTNWLL